MPTAGELTINLAANVAPLHKGLSEGGETVKGFALDLNSAIEGLGKLASGASGQVEKLAGSGLASLAKMGAGVALGAGAVEAAGKGVAETLKFGAEQLREGHDLAVSAERSTIAFASMLKDGEAAERMMGQLEAQASDSGAFQMPQLQEAAEKLVAFGFSGQRTISTLRMLEQVAAGTGAPIDGLAQAFGRVSATGKMSGRDIMAFTSQGVPVVRALGKEFGVADSEVMQLVQDGKVGFPQLEAAIAGMTRAGGQFAGLIESQADSLGGLESRLKENAEQIKQHLAEIVLGATGAKTALSGLVSVAEGLNTALRQGPGYSVGGEITQYSDFAKQHLLDQRTVFETAPDVDTRSFDHRKLDEQLGAAADRREAQRLAWNQGQQFLAPMQLHGQDTKLFDDLGAYNRLKQAQDDAAAAAQQEKEALDESNRAIAREQAERLKLADALAQELAAMEKQLAGEPKEEEQLSAMAAQIRDSVMTPLERLTETKGNLEHLHGLGELSDEQFARATKQAEAEFARASHVDSHATGAAQAGSRESYSAIARALNDSNKPDATTNAVNQWAQRFWGVRQKQDRNQAQPAKIA